MGIGGENLGMAGWERTPGSERGERVFGDGRRVKSGSMAVRGPGVAAEIRRYVHIWKERRAGIAEVATGKPIKIVSAGWRRGKLRRRRMKKDGMKR